MLDIIVKYAYLIGMKTKDATKFFGGTKALAKALGISSSAVSQWGEFVPKGRAYEIQILTNNKLVVGDRRHSPDRRAQPCAGRRASDKGQAA